MSSRFLIIDGYNLLHAAGMAQRNYSHGDLQRCRTRLIRFLLSKLTPAELDRATLVFDARVPPPDRPSEFRITGMRVQFANPGGDADELIEKMLAAHSSPTRVTLVSSDRRLQTAARRRHARAVASETFFDQMSERERPESRGGSRGRDPYEEIKQGPVLTAGEIASWQKVFGDITGATWSASVVKAPVTSGDLKPPPAKSAAANNAGESASKKGQATSSRSADPAAPERESPKNPKKKTVHRPPASRTRPSRGKDSAIPDVTWDDLCRWLEDDRWLAEFRDDREAGRK